MSNQGLFMYGMSAILVVMAGVSLVAIGIFTHWILIIIGIAIIIKGKAMRFDYQRQSGSIIHRGDW